MIPEETRTAPREPALRRLAAAFQSLGPGWVFALAVIGPADMVANTTLGATHGYALIWALAVVLVFRYVWLSTSAKYVLVTGESLLDGYSRLGRWVAWAFLAVILVMRHLQNLYKIALLGSVAHLLAPLPVGSSERWWSLALTGAAFAMVFWGGYPVLESFCKRLAAVMGAMLVAAAALSRPDPAGILRGALIPTIPESAGLYSTVLLLTALIGAEAGSLTNLTYSYFMYEKGWRDLSYRRRQNWDLAFSVGAIFLMGMLLQITAAGTLHGAGARLDNAGDLVRIFSAKLGLAGRLIFGLGLWAALFSSLVGTTTGYAMMATDICRKHVPLFRRPEGHTQPKRGVQHDPIFRCLVALWLFSPLYVLFTGWTPVWLVLAVSSAVVVLIPFLSLALLRITSDRRLMGAHQNGWFTNVMLVLLAGVSLYLAGRSAHVWLARVAP